MALGANKYSILTLSTPVEGSFGKESDGQSRGGGSNTTPGVGNGTKEDSDFLSADDYKILFSKLPSLYRAPSFSLQYTKRCIQGLKLHKWTTGTEVEGWLSHRFTLVSKKREKGVVRRRRRSSGRLTRSSRSPRSPNLILAKGAGVVGTPDGNEYYERNSEASTAQALDRVRSSSCSQRDSLDANGVDQGGPGSSKKSSSVFRNASPTTSADIDTHTSSNSMKGGASLGM